VDAITLLKHDHDEAKALFKKLEQVEGPPAAKLFGELKAALSLHEELEETHMYPQLKADPKAHDLILEAYQEHHVMDLLLEEISRLRPSDETWAPKIKVLQENTEHHIEEEEGDLFPKVQKIWGKERLEEVGQKMEQLHKARKAATSAA